MELDQESEKRLQREFEGKFFCRMIFVRHGQTEYTDIFPDLTHEGKEIMHKTAAKIKKILKHWNGECAIISSPSSRAMGSAAIIAEHILVKNPIVFEKRLRPMDFLKEKEGRRVIEEILEKTTVEKAYHEDRIFKDGLVFESQFDIKNRLLSFLGDILSEKADGRHSAACYVCVAHYEVLCHLLDLLFFSDYSHENTLSFGESFIVDFYSIGDLPALVFSAEAEFRGEKASNWFYAEVNRFAIHKSILREEAV